MYIHICIHLYICIYVCVYIYLYIYIYIEIFITPCIYIYICMYIYTCVHIHIHKYIYTYLHVCVYTYVYVYIHLYVYTYIHTPVYTYLSVYTSHLQKQADINTSIHICPLRGKTSRINVYILVVGGDIARHNIGEYICVHIRVCLFMCICVRNNADRSYMQIYV